MTQQRKALAAAFASVFAASFSAIFIRIAIEHGVNPVILAFWRLFLTCIFMLPYTISQKHYRRELINLSPKQQFLMVISGLFLSLHFSSWFVSLKFTSTVSSTLLVCTEPAFVLIGAYIFFKEKPSNKSIPGLIIAALGMTLIALPEASSSLANSDAALFGNFLALFGAISVSGYILVGRSIMATASTMLYSTFVYTICCLALGIIVLVMGFSLLDINTIGLIMAACLALVCQFLGHTICNWALKYTKAANVSSIYLLEPIGTAFLVFVLWQELPSMKIMAGGLLLLLGIFYFIRLESLNEQSIQENI